MPLYTVPCLKPFILNFNLRKEKMDHRSKLLEGFSSPNLGEAEEFHSKSCQSAETDFADENSGFLPTSHSQDLFSHPSNP